MSQLKHPKLYPKSSPQLNEAYLLHTTNTTKLQTKQNLALHIATVISTLDTNIQYLHNKETMIVDTATTHTSETSRITNQTKNRPTHTLSLLSLKLYSLPKQPTPRQNIQTAFNKYTTSKHTFAHFKQNIKCTRN